MASTEDLLLLRKTVESVKTLEQVALAKDWNNFLNAARELSDNVVKLVQMAMSNGAEPAAAELRESVKNAMGCAKILLRDKTDEALEQFRNYLKDVARVIIAITQIVRGRPAAGSVSAPAAPIAVRQIFLSTDSALWPSWPSVAIFHRYYLLKLALFFCFNAVYSSFHR